MRACATTIGGIFWLRRREPSWYLDPLVAQQKRQLYQDLVREWTRELPPTNFLKTDLFEEAYGEDHLLFDLLPSTYTPFGLDVSARTALRAKQRCPLPRACFLAADVRNLPLKSNVVGLVVSNSTLDHFDSRDEFRAALRELGRVLRPGGLLVIAVDNPLNPLYLPLRWLSRRRSAPYPLGYTTTEEGLVGSLKELRLEVLATGSLIHNPRIVSTCLFLGLRRLLGRRAETPIRFLLRLFAQLERLPTRRFTACFVAVCARKPAATSSLAG